MKLPSGTARDEARAVLARMGERGTLCIPAQMRRLCDLKTGDLLSVEPIEGGLALRPMVLVERRLAESLQGRRPATPGTEAPGEEE